jgi:uncharacterized protein YehS (DUF1456 family)
MKDEDLLRHVRSKFDANNLEIELAARLAEKLDELAEQEEIAQILRDYSIDATVQRELLEAVPGRAIDGIQFMKTLDAHGIKSVTELEELITEARYVKPYNGEYE